MPSNRPPGPRLGLAGMMGVMRDPYTTYRRYHERYGDYWFLHAPNGRIHITSSPEGAREVWSADPDLYLPFAVDAAAPALGDDSIFLMSGPRHRRERKLLMPAFHRDRVAQYGDRVRDNARRIVDALPSGGEATAQSIGMDVALDVIIDLVFGATELDLQRHIRDLVERTIDTLKPWMLFAPPLRRMPIAASAWRRFVAVREEAQQTMLAQIRAARAEPDGDSVLHDMIAATDEDGVGLGDSEIADEMITLLFAGHETTGVAIAWTMHHLLRHPDVVQRLREALAAVGDDPLAIVRCDYLDAVCKEALRITPIVPDVLRTLAEPATFFGREIPAGHVVAVSVAAIHQRADLYPEPDAFRPERFIDRRYRPWEYMPFGGGNHRCVGAVLAEFEHRLTVAELVTRCDLSLVDDRPARPVRRNITIAPADGARMRITPRRGAPTGASA